MPVCRVNDFDMAYTDGGTGPAMVLLHGFPLDSRVWEDAVDLLHRQFRVIAPDLRGFGGSVCDRPFTIASLADDIRQLIIHLHAGPCILGGLSMGGYVALAFAKQYAAELRGLALIDTKAAADSPEAKRGRQQMIELARREGSGAIADQMFPKMIAPAAATSSVGIKLRSIMQACPALTIEHALAAMRDREDFTALLPALALPTLIVVGADDAIATPEVARGMHAAAAGSKLAVIPKAGHMAPMENPPAFAEAMIAAFAGA